MKMFQATVRPGGGCILQKLEVMATSAIEAKNNLEMEFGDGNVVYFPKELGESLTCGEHSPVSLSGG
jgi:hypothetical protein